ncbi:MAG: DMT family transporter [Gammaproteobacteria bacterium]
MTDDPPKNFPQPRELIGIGYILLSGIGVACLPTTARLAYESGSDAYTVAFVRGVLATMILAALVPLTGRRLHLPRALLRPSLVAGVAGALFVYGIYLAIRTTHISLVLLIVYLFPITLALYEHCRGTLRLKPAQWVWGTLACLGMAFILGLRFEQIDSAGIALAILAMVSVIVITLVNFEVTQTTGSLVSNFYMTLWGTIIFGIVLFALGDFRAPQTALGYISLAGNGIAYCVTWVAFFAGAKILGASRASMISLSEPALAALFAWVVFGENYTLAQWCGFALVLASIILFEKRAQQAS